ncbi:MAG: hypothetical protein ACI4M3_07440 [Acutalibacteraceae bacterium]
MGKTEPIKIIYSEEEKTFKVVGGIVDLGYMGVYKTENIQIAVFDGTTLENVFNDKKQSQYYSEVYKPLRAYLRKDMANDEIAEGLEKFYNERIADINKHQIELNQIFLSHILDDIFSSGFPFWEECPDYTVTEKMPQCDEDDIYDFIFNDEANKMSQEIYAHYQEKTCIGAVDTSTPVADFFRAYLPTLNLDKFLASICGEYLTLDKANIVFECSGKGQAIDLACGAYAEITVSNSFYDWHNF